MRKLGIDFAKAAAGKGGQQIKTAAAKLNENCNRCHSIYKD
jgi:cytochrome c556